MLAPLLPRRRPQPKGARLWVDDRATLNGILYVLAMNRAILNLGCAPICWNYLQRLRVRTRPSGLEV